jgi:hypothetical protein
MPPRRQIVEAYGEIAIRVQSCCAVSTTISIGVYLDSYRFDGTLGADFANDLCVSNKIAWDKEQTVEFRGCIGLIFDHQREIRPSARRG